MEAVQNSGVGHGISLGQKDLKLMAAPGKVGNMKQESRIPQVVAFRSKRESVEGPESI